MQKNVLELLFDVERGKNELNEKEDILKECHGNNILDFEKNECVKKHRPLASPSQPHPRKK